MPETGEAGHGILCFEWQADYRSGMFRSSGKLREGERACCIKSM